MSQSLSSLCSICHVQKPHYKCPRCSTRTCSLKCSKLHKARTLCSGVRDPGTYATRKELNEPAAFDKDFNFITGVERGIESANRGSVQRGIVRTDDGQDKRPSGPPRGEVPLRKSIESDGITILRAPQGMALSRSNKTHWRRNGGGIIWSIKWKLDASIVDDGVRSERGTVEWSRSTASECHEGYDKDPVKNSQKDSDGTIIQHFTDWIKSGIADIAQGRNSDSTLNCNQDLKRRQIAAHLERALLQGLQHNVDGSNTNLRPSFYLEAPDKNLPGKTALIPFDVFKPSTVFKGRSLTFKDLLRNKTIQEYPQVRIWMGRLPPLNQFFVVETPAAEGDSTQKSPSAKAQTVKRERDTGRGKMDEKATKKVKKQHFTTRTPSWRSTIDLQMTPIVLPNHQASQRKEANTEPKATLASQTTPLPAGIVGLDYSSD